MSPGFIELTLDNVRLCLASRHCLLYYQEHLPGFEYPRPLPVRQRGGRPVYEHSVPSLTVLFVEES